MRIIIVRTAEYGGISDSIWPLDETALTSVGKNQMYKLSKLTIEPIDTIYSSPTVRSIDTVKMLAENRGLEIKLVDAFKPLNMGEFFGKSYDWTREALGADAWHEVLTAPKPDVRYFKGWETLSELADRVWLGIEMIIEKHEESDGVVVISTHEEVIGTILCKMSDMPLSRLWWWAGRLKSSLYGSITEVLWENGRWTLVHFGCTKHLEGL